ncbi:hypothetical protein AM1_3365 [Acaryochloris marina MBIC11017]|uniref:Uncharacterized protein n=1 Tax=Acaryochloris marina (strain MBIC 11017) TaxID=329726 RepID=B0C013_ACAM1|nr:hypothetical protein AM1_3365 [Acaryochloris marina MBIC11017]
MFESVQSNLGILYFDHSFLKNLVSTGYKINSCCLSLR